MNYGTKQGHFWGYWKVILVHIRRWSHGTFQDDNNIFHKIKNDLATGTWQDNIWCPINIILLCISDGGRKRSHLLVTLWIFWMWVCPQGMNYTCAQPVSGHRYSSLSSKHVLWSSHACFASLVAAPYRCPSQLGVWICDNNVHLSKGPTENDSEDDHKPDGKPCHNGGVCLKIVHSVDLLSAV